MLIYDQTILAFIKKSELILKEILKEAGIEIRSRRFLFRGYLHPINVVVFEGKDWGHFDPAFLQIALNRKLIYQAKDSVVRDVLRHELAHYLTFIEHGAIAAHGPEFHSICRRYGFPREVELATMEVNRANDEKVGDLDAERVLEKVKKLFQLAQSTNAYEAELATIKANSLLLRHNLDRLKSDSDPLYLDRVLMQKRTTPKLLAIQSIMKHFIVKCVLNNGKGISCLAISGTMTNIKLARYVAEFLDREFDYLWEREKKESGLRGLRAKNSFFMGIARGYDQKMEQSRRALASIDQKALITVHTELEEKSKMIYSRLSSIRSGASVDSEAGEKGVARGRGLTIRQGVESTSKGLYLPC